MTAVYPKVRPVIGGLDDSSTIEKEAAAADVVIHTADASDHVGSAQAIAKGLVSGHSKERPGYWLHTGGTGILTYFDSSANKIGEHSDKVFNDWDGIEELTNLPAEAFHRNVDEIVLNCSTEHGDAVKTAIVCPPTIYGPGRGPANQRSRQVYELATFILEQKYVPKIGKGLARWNNVHVHDLSHFFELLTEAAVAHKTDSELWGAKGYYFVEHGEFVWGDTAVQIGDEAVKQGLLQKPEVKELSYDDAVNSPAGFQAASWGLNSRAKAIRGKKLLGWEPKGPSLEQAIPYIVKAEAARLRKS